MKKTLLFAIDPKTQETIVSESQKGSRSVDFRERIARADHELLYDSVVLLTQMARMPQPDAALFKAMDKVCQLIYTKFLEQRGMAL